MMATEVKDDQKQKPLVFISWSGELGRKIGLALNEFLEVHFSKTFPSYFDVYYSDKSDGFWGEALFRNIQNASHAIFIVTPELLDSDWCLFEYGGISVNALKRTNVDDSINSVGKLVLPIYFSEKIDRMHTPFDKLQLKFFNDIVTTPGGKKKSPVLCAFIWNILKDAFDYARSREEVDEDWLIDAHTVLREHYNELHQSINDIVSKCVVSDNYTRRYKLKEQVRQLTTENEEHVNKINLLENQLTYPYVDLGTDVFWASYNFGKKDADLDGCYFRWDDKINSIFNGDWRLPTKNDFEKLASVCYYEWKEDYNGSGFAGMLFTNKETGNSCFFPAAGGKVPTALSDAGSRGYYWTSSKGRLGKVSCLRLCNVEGHRFSFDDYEIACGFSIRAVLPKEKK